MSNEIWKGQLNELGWEYWKECSTCSGLKHYYKRGNEIMEVWPSRGFYKFKENGKIVTGKLSNLQSVIDAAKNQTTS